MARVWSFNVLCFSPGNIQLGYGACSIWNEAESVLRGRGFTLDDVKLTLACTPMKEMLQRQFGLTFTATAIDKELITDSDNYACTFTQSFQNVPSTR